MDEKVTWNLAFNVMYRTLEIAGWPKLVIRFEGPASGKEKIIKGYASCIFPVTPGTHKIKAHIFKPVTSQFLGVPFGEQVKEHNKETDAALIISGKNRDSTTVECMGYVMVDATISHKNFDKFYVQV